MHMAVVFVVRLYSKKSLKFTASNPSLGVADTTPNLVILIGANMRLKTDFSYQLGKTSLHLFNLTNVVFQPSRNNNTIVLQYRPYKCYSSSDK